MSEIIWSILLKNQGVIADRCQEVQSLERRKRVDWMTARFWCPCGILPWAAILALALKSCSGEYLSFERLLAGWKLSPAFEPEPSRSEKAGAEWFRQLLFFYTVSLSYAELLR
jgi:hypothetical protein